MTYSEHQLGNVIRKYRKERGMTQSQLSELAEISHRQVMSIEKGKCYPKFETLCRLVRVLNIPPDHIFHSESLGDDSALNRFIAIYRSCPIEDQDLVLATMQALITKINQKHQTMHSA